MVAEKDEVGPHHPIDAPKGRVEDIPHKVHQEVTIEWREVWPSDSDLKDRA